MRQDVATLDKPAPPPRTRWPADPRIDLRAVDGFNNRRPAAAHWADNEAQARRDRDNTFAGLILLAAAAILAGALLLPEPLLTAVMRGAF